MRLPEFVEAVESYGVTLPRQWRLGTASEMWYGDILDLEAVGSGAHRQYTERTVRRAVAWRLIMASTGNTEHGRHWASASQCRQAMRLLAAAPEGWVVMADGRAWWSLVPPVRTLRSRCAVAIPVPDWKH